MDARKKSCVIDEMDMVESQDARSDYWQYLMESNDDMDMKRVQIAEEIFDVRKTIARTMGEEL